MSPSVMMLKKTVDRLRKREINIKRRLWEYLIMFFGATIVAIATKNVFDPSGLVTGGVSGLSIIVKHMTRGIIDGGIPLWVSTLVLNIPIFLWTLFTVKINEIFRTLAAWGIMTVELMFLPEYNLIPNNILLTSIFGGVLFGVGTGLLLSVKSTTAGTDLLGSTASHYIRFLDVARLIQIFDGSIVAAGVLVFGLETTLYAAISVFVCYKCSEAILSSGKSAKIIYIISEAYDEIANEILYQTKRGLTGISCRGMYTNDEKTMLMCVCSVRNIVSIKDVVSYLDPDAFMIIGDASEVLGEGFIEKWAQE